jgi:three-Cys-motif partner protein
MPKVDLTKYAGREQAYVKHRLLEEYLSHWGYKVGSSWDSLVYVDGFAGPWESKDQNFADSSFGIATRVLNQVVSGLREARNVRGLCLFVEKKPDAFAKLQTYANTASNDNVAVFALKGRLVENLTKIAKHIASSGNNAFKFVFLDQKGWAATPMSRLQPFLQNRSCEVLFNLMTSFLTRFVDNEDRASSYEQLFGRSGVLERIRELPKGTGEREEAAVREFCKTLRDLCGFRYVSEAVILDPEKEKVRYYLVFATNHHKGIEVFKNAEMKAARLQDYVRHQTQIQKSGQDELPLGDGPPTSPISLRLRDLYYVKAKKKFIETLRKAPTAEGVSYRDLYCETMAFPLVTPADLDQWLRELWSKIEIRFSGSLNRKKLSPDVDDRVVVIDQGSIGLEVH